MPSVTWKIYLNKGKEEKTLIYKFPSVHKETYSSTPTVSERPIPTPVTPALWAPKFLCYLLLQWGLDPATPFKAGVMPSPQSLLRSGEERAWISCYLPSPAHLVRALSHPRRGPRGKELGEPRPTACEELNPGNGSRPPSRGGGGPGLTGTTAPPLYLDCSLCQALSLLGPDL